MRKINAPILFNDAFVGGHHLEGASYPHLDFRRG